jgi:hypothetical protein
MVALEFNRAAANESVRSEGNDGYARDGFRNSLMSAG